MNPDIINALFEGLAAFAVYNHARLLYKQKIVRGVSAMSTAFFFSWGLWNLYYYPFLGQWYSFLAGLAIMVANSVWLGLMIHYIRKEKRDG